MLVVDVSVFENVDKQRVFVWPSLRQVVQSILAPSYTSCCLCAPI